MDTDGSTTPEEPEATVDQALLGGPVPYRGTSLAGAEFAADPWGNGTFPGNPGTDYVYPDPAYASGYNSATYYVGKGMTAFRLPFRWERLQPTLNQAFNSAEQGRLTTTVNDLVAKGAVVVLDPHNYARYHTNLIGSASVSNANFADFWTKLATLFKSNPKVIFGLMNEPHDVSTEQWVSAANAAITAIRATGATNLILVPGNGYTGAHSWSQSWYGTPNATALLNISDPGNNYAFEVHQYLDSDYSGTHADCVSGTVGSTALSGFTSWLKANNKRGFLGEFGGGANATCSAAMDDMLKHIEANSDVWLGWTNWAGGPWWGSYSLSIEPSGGNNSVQMNALIPHLAWGGGADGGTDGGGVSIPAAPTNLGATAGNAQVSLSWTASSGATSYAVLRSTTNGSGYVSVASGLAGTSYTNTGLTNGTTYYYVVTASNAAGTSGNSNQASATPTAGQSIPAAPTGLTATAGNAQVSLSWTASAGATSYAVLRSTTNGGGYVSVASGLASPSYTNTGLTNGTTYYYVVTASNAAGTSGNSSQASATPSGGGGSAPCSGAITVTGGQSGNFNTTGAACYRTADNINGWGCSNFDGRTLSVDGSAVSCGAMPLPAKWADGYRYFSVSAGTYSYASFYWW